MTARSRKKVAKRPRKLALGRKGKGRGVRGPAAQVPDLELTAQRTATTRIRVTRDGEIVIEDALLSYLVRKWEMEKLKVNFKVVPPHIYGDSDEDVILDDNRVAYSKSGVDPPPNTNCPCP